MKKGILAGLICIIAAAAAVVCVLVIPALSRLDDPLTRTLIAVAPELKELRGKNLRLTLSTSRDDDFMRETEEKSFDFSAVLTSSESGETGFYFLGEANDEKSDFYFRKNDEGLLAGSGSSSENNSDYYIENDYVRDALKQSAFAPDSGSSYALSEETFDFICSILASSGATDNNQSNAFIDRFSRIIGKATEGITPDEAEGNVELFGVTVKAKICSTKLDKKFLLSLLEAVETEYGKGCVPASEKEKASDSGFTAELRWAEYKKYLVLVEGKVKDEKGKFASMLDKIAEQYGKTRERLDEI